LHASLAVVRNQGIAETPDSSIVTSGRD